MKATIIEIIQETAEISSFKFVPSEPLKYIPGQWMYVRLTPDLKHHFTISSSPTENFLMITTKRTDSDYKQALFAKKPGDEVEINGSFGSFTLNTDDISPRLFIAGGIGITPFRSMIKFTQDKLLTIPYVLLYSVKTREDLAFKDLWPQVPEAKIIESATQGHIDETKIREYCADWQTRTIWVCGPPTMVEAMVELVQKMGQPSEKIKSEEFTGYQSM